MRQPVSTPVWCLNTSPQHPRGECATPRWWGVVLGVGVKFLFKCFSSRLCVSRPSAGRRRSVRAPKSGHGTDSPKNFNLSCFPVSTPVSTPVFLSQHLDLGVSTPVLVSQHLPLKANSCLNVKTQALLGARAGAPPAGNISHFTSHVKFTVKFTFHTWVCNGHVTVV